MQLKFLTPLTMGMLFSASIEASGEMQPLSQKVDTIQEEPKNNLDSLKKIHDHNQIFDDYEFGGIAP